MSASPAAAVGLTERLVGAPISWGVCEVPGWGPTLDPETVLSEMAAIGLRGTELGPVGYLPGDPDELSERLAAHGLRAIAAFVPVVFAPGLADADLAGALDAAESLAAAGGEVLLVAAIPDPAWTERPPLDARELAALAAGMQRLDAAVSARGVAMAVHPHVGSVIERAAEVERLLDASDLRWCLDTGHLMIGGCDQLRFAREHADRIVHVHLKDVDARLAREVAERRLDLPKATRRGLFRPLGDGDAPIGAVLEELERRRYDGWLTLEQDTMFDAAGPRPRDDVARSVEFVRAFDRGRR